MEPVRRKGVQSNTTLIESYGRQGHPISHETSREAAERESPARKCRGNVQEETSPARDGTLPKHLIWFESHAGLF